jgi:peptidyl-dipeptidase A
VRYFLSFIIQFQFYKALCDAAGHTGPLHTCSFAGNQAAGARLAAMLSLAARRPWPEAMETLTGQRAMDADALLEYFAPLRAWLALQNEGVVCGW